MNYGELEEAKPTAPPKLDLSWSAESKIETILEWLDHEFQPFSDFTLDSLVDVDEIENFDELLSSVWDHVDSSRDLILEYFGNSILANQLDKIVREIDGEYQDDLFPADHRLNVLVFGDELEGGSSQINVKLAQAVLNDIPSILELLSAVRRDIPDNVGHNQGPDFLLSRERVQKFEEQLEELQNTLLAPKKQTEPLVAETGKGLRDLGLRMSAHVGEMTKLSTLKFAEKFGESAGSWAGRAAILVIFGEKLLQLLL